MKRRDLRGGGLDLDDCVGGRDHCSIVGMLSPNVVLSILWMRTGGGQLSLRSGLTRVGVGPG